MLPLIFLILLGLFLQRVRFFEEVSFKRLQSFLLKVTIPSLIFTAFVNMEFYWGQILISVGMFFFMSALLLSGFILYRLFSVKHDFFIFSFSAFGFGTIGLPVFLDLFGMENSTGMVLLGVGHELFIVAVLIPILQLYYSKSGITLQTLLSPTILMVVFGAIIGLGNFGPAIAGNFIGAGLFDTIDRLGRLTLPIAMILAGYRLTLGDKQYLKISLLYAAARLGVVLSLGIAFQTFFLSAFPPSLLLGHAFFTMTLQHGSIILLVYVGQYRPLEDQAIVNNAFVLNMTAGLLLFFLYMLLL